MTYQQLLTEGPSDQPSPSSLGASPWCFARRDENCSGIIFEFSKQFDTGEVFIVHLKNDLNSRNLLDQAIYTYYKNNGNR
jgi:hypothetical protein